METERQKAAQALHRTVRLSFELVYEATLLAEASGLSDVPLEQRRMEVLPRAP